MASDAENVSIWWRHHVNADKVPFDVDDGRPFTLADYGCCDGGVSLGLFRHIIRESLIGNSRWYIITLQWRHNEYDVVSIHQPYDVCSTVYSGTERRKRQSSVSLAFLRGIHRWPVNSPHEGPVTRKMILFDDVIMSKPFSLCMWFSTHPRVTHNAKLHA